MDFESQTQPLSPVLVAAVVSAIIHLILFTLLFFSPLGDWLSSQKAVDLTKRDSTIKFTFKPVAEKDADGNATPRFTIPRPSPVTPSQPQRTANLEPLLRQQPQQVSPSQDRNSSTNSESVAQNNTNDQSFQSETRSARPVEQSDLPLQESSENRDFAQTRGNTGSGNRGSSFDLGRAMREFDGALRNSQARIPRAGDRPSNVFRPDALDLPTQGFGMGELVFSSTDYDWSDYGRQVYIAIWREWHRQLYYGTDEFEREGFSTQNFFMKDWDAFTFTIVRDGGVTRIQLLDGSNFEPLDDATQRTLEGVVLPPLPEAFPRDSEVATFTFSVLGDIRNMRSHLNYLRKRGFFSAGTTIEDLPEPPKGVR